MLLWTAVVSYFHCPRKLFIHPSVQVLHRAPNVLLLPLHHPPPPGLGSAVTPRPAGSCYPTSGFWFWFWPALSALAARRLRKQPTIPNSFCCFVFTASCSLAVRFHFLREEEVHRLKKKKEIKIWNPGGVKEQDDQKSKWGQGDMQRLCNQLHPLVQSVRKRRNYENKKHKPAVK